MASLLLANAPFEVNALSLYPNTYALGKQRRDVTHVRMNGSSQMPERKKSIEIHNLRSKYTNANIFLQTHNAISKHSLSSEL